MKKPAFTAEFFRGNRRRLRALVEPGDLLVIQAAAALSDYCAHRFRQDSNFWYLTGIDEPNMTLVMDGDKEYLIVPKKSAVEIAFDGALDDAEMCKTSGIDEILPQKAGRKRLGKRKPADVQQQLASLRMIKSKLEIAAIQYAIDHTTEAFKLVGKNLASYQTEQSIEADMTHYFIQNRLRHSYSPIIAGGMRAVTLHYNKNNQTLNPAECLLLDVGAASASYYCADITRTVAVNPSARLSAVYGAVLAVQKFAINYLKPGIMIKDYEIAVRKLMGKKLLDLGLIKTIDKDLVRQFYPHGTSHFLGLDVHDIGDYSQPLVPGMVLTVEPGIYIQEESIGVRIEDNILITSSGNRVLSADLPKQVSSLTINASI